MTTVWNDLEIPVRISTCHLFANKTGETGSSAKQGSETLQLADTSTYTGNTAINNGVVKLTTGNDRLPSGMTVSLGQDASASVGTLD